MVNFVQNLVIYAVWHCIFKDSECKFRVRDGIFELADGILGEISVNFGLQHIARKKRDVESEPQTAPGAGLRMMQSGELTAVPYAELNLEPAAVYRHYPCRLHFRIGAEEHDGSGLLPFDNNNPDTPLQPVGIDCPCPCTPRSIYLDGVKEPPVRFGYVNLTCIFGFLAPLDTAFGKPLPGWVIFQHAIGLESAHKDEPKLRHPVGKWPSGKVRICCHNLGDRLQLIFIFCDIADITVCHGERFAVVPRQGLLSPEHDCAFVRVVYGRECHYLKSAFGLSGDTGPVSANSGCALAGLVYMGGINSDNTMAGIRQLLDRYIFVYAEPVNILGEVVAEGLFVEIGMPLQLEKVYSPFDGDYCEDAVVYEFCQHFSKFDCCTIENVSENTLELICSDRCVHNSLILVYSNYNAWPLLLYLHSLNSYRTIVMNHSNLKITIVTVSYNAATEIERTILSVIDQSYDNLEYIVIDGGSNDGTVDIIKKYINGGSECSKHHHCIAYWQSESDGGIYDAMNKGIMISTGDYINFMNAGDSFVSHKIIEEIDFDKDIIYGNTINTIYDLKYRKRPDIISNLKKHMVFCHQASFIKTNLMKKHMFNTNFRIAADYCLFYNLLVKGVQFKYIDKDISFYEAETGISVRSRMSQLKEYCQINGSNRLLKKAYWLSLMYLCFNFLLRDDFKKINRHRILNSDKYEKVQ